MPDQLPRRGMSVLVLGAILGMFSAGCSAFRFHEPQGPRFEPPPSNRSDRRLLNVPFFADGTDQCGPSTLASVLTFWGHPTDPRTLRGEIYLAHLRGSLPMDLLLAAESRGFQARLYAGSLDDLKAQLSRGYPLVAFINRGFSFLPLGHYVVVNGYDEARRGVYLHSGKAENRFVRFEAFLKDWDKTERSTLLILPFERGAGRGHTGA
jgi:predicted double-glycine peptidase